MGECADEVAFACDISDKLDDLIISQLKDVTVECNCINGYFEHLDTFSNITMQMKDRGYTFSVRDSEIRKKRTIPAKEEGSDKEHGPNTVFFEQRVMNIKFFGLPFTVDKTTHYQCTYGCKYYKSKAKEKNDSSSMLLTRKRRSVVSKKIGCLAKMSLKKVTVYPDYMLDAIKNWKKKKLVIKNLRNDLNTNPDQVIKTCRYYVCISVQSSHNHPPILKDVQSPKPKRKKTSESPKKIMTKDATVEGDWVTLYSDKDGTKALTTDATFFNSLVKFPTNTVTYSRVEIRGFDVEQLNKQEESGNFQLEATIDYSVHDLQLSFKEKLKRLYTLSENCNNTGLLLRLIADLEQVDNALINDIGYDPSL